MILLFYTTIHTQTQFITAKMNNMMSRYFKIEDKQTRQWQA